MRATARSDSEEAIATTAFDVAAHWSRVPRYGFLSDFSEEESEEESVRRLDDMLRLHLNAVQFYDWMPNHYELVAPTAEYVDTLGRRLSAAVVRRKIELCRERGMAALAYGALYGAEKPFADAHREWLLYDEEHRPLNLAGLYFLQDFSTSSGWRQWILQQYDAAIAAFSFDGIHIDQYGFPKHALSRATGTWRSFETEREFPGFVEEASARVLAQRPDGGCVFNCVNAWPLERMAEVNRDAATYIEVWEPHTGYRDLYELVRRSRALRPDKATILAAYLRPFHPETARTPEALSAFRLTFAAIVASGGSQLVAGEGRRLLTEAYYPRYGALSDNEFAVVRRYFDFAVRNAGLLGGEGPDLAWTHIGPTNDVITLRHRAPCVYGAGAQRDSIWTTLRRIGDRWVLQLVNLRGLQDDRWNAARSAPEPVEDVEITVRGLAPIEDAVWDTPDDETGTWREARGKNARGESHLCLPRLDTWALLSWRR